MASTYLKMRASSAADADDNRSKSVDFSELLQPLSSHSQPCPPRASMEKTGWNIETLVECHHDINGERFGTVLGICRSVASPTDPRKGFHLESKQNSGMYSAVKRVFSMRRSASVSETYCRIHDQSDTPAAYFEGEDSMDEESGSPMKPVKKQQQYKGDKIIQACKRFFNLK